MDMDEKIYQYIGKIFKGNYLALIDSILGYYIILLWK